MKYMFTIYSVEDGWTEEESTQCIVDSSAICHELAAKGEFIAAAPLWPVATAKSVRVREGKRLVTDGPFAETVEQLGGYYIVDVANLDEAIAIASRLPPAKKGTVEIRPLVQLEGLPSDMSDQSESSRGRGTRYMLLCYDHEPTWANAGSAALDAARNEAVMVACQLSERGQYVSASPLHSVSTATSVRVRDGKRQISDGPFAETNEVLGGYYIVVAESLDEACDIAARHPGARHGTVEVRQIRELPPTPIPEADEIMSSRDFPFSREQMFEAFSQPDRLARWWGPNGFRNTFEEFQFQPQGNWRFVMHGPNGTDYPNHNVFDSIVAPERIVIDHVLAPQFRLTITLGELPGNRTRLVWRMKFATVELRNQIAKFAIDANEQNFDRLTNELS